MVWVGLLYIYIYIDAYVGAFAGFQEGHESWDKGPGLCAVYRAKVPIWYEVWFM